VLSLYIFHIFRTALRFLSDKLFKSKYKYILLLTSLVGAVWVIVGTSNDSRKTPQELMLDTQMVVGEIETDVVSKYFDKRDEKLTKKVSEWTTQDEIELHALREAYDSVVTLQEGRLRESE